MSERKCPIGTVLWCADWCGWYMDGRCAMVVLAESILNIKTVWGREDHYCGEFKERDGE